MPDPCLRATNKPGTQVALQSIRAKSGVTWWQKVKAAWVENGHFLVVPYTSGRGAHRVAALLDIDVHTTEWSFSELPATISRWVRATQIHLKLQECLLKSSDLKVKICYHKALSIICWCWSHIFCCRNNICCHTIKCLPHWGRCSIQRDAFLQPYSIFTKPQHVL